MLAQDLPDPTTWHRLTNIVFDMCMHGGERKKSTTFTSSPDFLEALQLACDGSHKRASWKPQAMGGSVIFPTAGEAEYPKLRAQRYAQAVHRALLREGVAFEGSHMQAGVAKPRDLRAFTKRAAPPLMPEYWLVCPLCCVFPKKGDVVVQVKGVADVEKLVEDHAGVAKTLVALRGENAKVFRLPLQTVRATAPLSHPLELALPVPDPVIRAILKVLRLGPFALRQLRIQTLESLHHRRRQLQKSEDEIHKALRPDLRTVLAGKSTILWQQLLEETSFPDPTLIEGVRKGFELVRSGSSLCSRRPSSFESNAPGGANPPFASVPLRGIAMLTSTYGLRLSMRPSKVGS